LSQAWVSTSRKRNSANKQGRLSMERQRKSNARISSSPSGQLRASSWACWLAAAPRGLTYACFASHSPSCFGKRRFQRLGRTPTVRRTHECPSHMAAVMCAVAVTTSATAGRRARQLSRRVGAQSCDILDVTPRDRGGQCCHSHRRDGRRGRSPHRRQLRARRLALL
jgi:hypothetical protein